MRQRAPARRRSPGVKALACAALVAVALAACGGGQNASSTSSARASVSSPAAIALLAAAEKAIDRVHGFHLQASATVDGKTDLESGDFVIPGRAALDTRQGASTLDLREINGEIYFRANRAYYLAAKVASAQLSTLPGRWIAIAASALPTSGSLLALTHAATLGLCLLGQHLGTLSLGGRASVNGRLAEVVVDAGNRPGSAPGRIYVAASRPPLPLRITTSGGERPGGTVAPACKAASTTAGASASNVLITAVVAPATITAPADTISAASLTAPAHASSGIAAAPVKTAHTKLGTVAYRVLGSGPPLVAIMGYGGTMQTWDPRFINALAAHYRVVVFDNAGIDGTQALAAPLTIDAMADQTSALMATLGLGRANVLGWSMGGMIAQALALRHPTQVRRLVLCATFTGTGTATTARPPQSDIDALTSGKQPQATLDLFPADQAKAAAAFGAALATYPPAAGAPAAVVSAQAHAVTLWWDGADTAGKQTAKIAAPTLVADGSVDVIDPVANDRKLAHTISGAKLVLYPGAGHAFLFQDEASFVPLIEAFLR